jgi:hypothetical protein
MTARIVLLMVAVVGLAACESTKAVDTAPSTPVAVQTPPAEPSSPTVVRSALVPDDEADIAAVYGPKKHRVKAPSYDTAAADPVEVSEPAAPVSKPEKPAKPSKPSKAETTAPVTTADAASPPPAAPTTDTTTTTPAPTDTAPDDSATPTTSDVTPAADGTAPKSLFSDPASLLQAQFGGFPVWLIGLVGLVLIVALMIGLGGRKKPEEVI